MAEAPSRYCVALVSNKRSSKGVTIADVAREADVSPTTVSHSLNGIGQVHERTRQRVIEVAERLNYRPSVRAQQLRAGRSQAIALLSSMPAAVSAGASRLGFFTELAMGCAEIALMRDYVLVLAPPMTDHSPLTHVDIDGAILLEPSPADQLADELITRGIPFVSIDGPANALSVDLHHEQAADVLLAHLLDRGATSIGLVASSSGRNAQRVFQDRYRTVAGRVGFPVIMAEANEADGEQGGYQATADLLAKHPDVDALCVSIDTFATGAVQAAVAAGRQIGDDLLVATRYNGTRAQTSSPPLTAVDLHLGDVSGAAVNLLLDQLGNTTNIGVAGAPTPEPSLVLRESTGIRAQSKTTHLARE